ncbi:MAG: hypothetical protein ACFE85_16085, partial [Candidatus Hodarchaeota archaeon]
MNKKLRFVLILSSIFLLNIFFQILDLKNDFANNQNTILEKSNDNLNIKLKTSDYSSTHEGIGTELNITLQQSLVNNSVVEFLNLDDSNTFTEPVPNFSGYNTSYVNISVDAINAPNKTLNLELGTTLNGAFFNERIVSSFRIRKSCILQNLSLYISESGGGTSDDATIRIQIFNSTWNSVESRIEPDSDTGLIDQTQIIPNEDTGQWYNYTFNVNLDASSTYDNTFFIYFRQTSDIFDTRAYYHYELDSSGEDNSDTYYSTDGGATWNEFSTDRDISSQIILGLNDNTPKPTDINLQINSTAITDDISGNNLGYWTPSQVFSSSTGEFNFSITADWWEVSCNVSNVHINYTKTDIRANSDFNIPASGQDVNWTVTIPGGLNYFDSRVDNYNAINFTIPEIWQETTIKVFNDTTESLNLIKTLLGNEFREVQVLNAGNGTNWFLTANSTNLLSSIDSYVGGINTIVANYSNTVDFNATFSTLINNGNINLSIYNPQYIDNKLNYSREITTFNPGIEIDLGNWDIASNITQYGNFRIVTFWNNDTAAGFIEKQITVLGETEVTITQPSQNSVFNSNEIFNATVNFKDIGQNFGIDNAIIEYRISGGIWSSDNVTDLGEGNYNITINCSDSLFDGYGNFNVEINVSKSLYNNQTFTLDFKILGLTTSQIDSPPQDQIYNSDAILTIVLSFDDSVENVPIDSADIQWKVGLLGTYSGTNVSYVSGNYEVEIWLRASEFDGYGPFTVFIMLNKTNYYNQTESLNFNILGLTTSQIDSPAQDQTYDSDEIIIIVLSFDDSVKS